MQNIKSIFLLVLALAALAGCKPVLVLRQDKALALPQNFDSNVAAAPDSTGLAAMNWRDFQRPQPSKPD